MLAQLDDNGYFTGRWSTVGDLANAVEGLNLPDTSASEMERICYKYSSEGWLFDNERYQNLLKDQYNSVLDEAKMKKIAETKKALASFLDTHKISSSCHGEMKEYSITSEKQQYLANMILTAQMAEQAGVEYQVSWNAAGEPCTYDWNVEQLRQLAFEIETDVRPLVSKQQAMEVQLREASNIEELHAIKIDFKMEDSKSDVISSV